MLQKPVNRFKFRNVQLKEGTLCTDTTHFQEHLNGIYPAWHDRKVLHSLAQYIHTHPTLWKDIEDLRRLPKMREKTEGSKEVTESMINLFSDALIHPGEISRDTWDKLYADITLREFKEVIRSTNKSPGNSEFPVKRLKMRDSNIIEQIFELPSGIWKEHHILESCFTNGPQGSADMPT